MTNIIFLFGTLAGLIVVGLSLGLILSQGGHMEMGDHSVFLGYAIMIVALTMVFFGVKRYRDRDLGGVIKFFPAFFVGLGIAIVAGIIYVAGWEVYMAATNYTFMDKFVEVYIESERAKGLSGEPLAKMISEMDAMRIAYNTNPLYRMSMTFIEIFPVGTLIALISAAILRNTKVLPA